MAFYLVQLCYRTKAWAALVRNPQNRLDIAGPVVKNLGGNIDVLLWHLGIMIQLLFFKCLIT